MKELTIEEKAKRFDEALENARYYHDAMEGDVCCVLEECFPQLKESEDERIRKELIFYFQEEIHQCSVQEHADKMKEFIAWLEKQGSEPNWCHHKVDSSGCSEEYRKAYYDGWNNCNMQHSQCASEKNDVIKCIINGMKLFSEGNENATWGTTKWNMPVKHILEVLEGLVDKDSAEKSKDEEYNGEDYGIDSLYHAQRILEKTLGKVDGYQSDDGILSHKCAITAVKKLYEQKSAKWSREDEQNLNAALGYIDDEYLRRWLKDVIHAKYDKPAWSEEDEKMLDYALDMIEWYSGKNEDKSRLVSNWLRSIKDRVQPQPKQEWSEEDEQMLNIITSDVLRTRQKCGIGTDEWSIRSKAIIWLKSLRHHKQWRPTDEQLMELKCAIRGCSFNIERLVSLEEQLKQL